MNDGMCFDVRGASCKLYVIGQQLSGQMAGWAGAFALLAGNCLRICNNRKRTMNISAIRFRMTVIS